MMPPVSLDCGLVHPRIVNAMNDCGRTPLYLAAQKGIQDITETLITSGASAGVTSTTNNVPVEH